MTMRIQDTPKGVQNSQSMRQDSNDPQNLRNRGTTQYYESQRVRGPLIRSFKKAVPSTTFQLQNSIDHGLLRSVNSTTREAAGHIDKTMGARNVGDTHRQSIPYVDHKRDSLLSMSHDEELSNVSKAYFTKTNQNQSSQYVNMKERLANAVKLNEELEEKR